MIAVVELGGNQFTVKVGDVIDVDSQKTEAGATFETPALLVADADGANVKVGTPFVEGAKVQLRVVDNFRGEKITVFKMKSKKRYARTRGFRPELTSVEVLSIA